MLTKNKDIRLSRIYNSSQNRSGGRWELSTTYADWHVSLQIKFDAVETIYTLYLCVDGEFFEVITQGELQERKQIAAAHDDVYDDREIHAIYKSDNLNRVKDELIARWAALQFIVSPEYTI